VRNEVEYGDGIGKVRSDFRKKEKREVQYFE
jgi:hypothetical protein